ncbi:response regulator [Phenylobacterium montanum]|uniref:Response regulator n=1 Tax=Phenylobacterium montanum TaxID=2823693 RepID=A0A975IWJ6_9CAUL|nr:response regulator [Caulobacter sp. S6]QUD90152.1 response regulator [Caulobacter sp. S6]
MPSRLNGLRLLVVEDEALIALTLEDMLDGFGCVVAGVAGTLKRAVALADELAIDGAVLDVNLGGERVYPAAERLKARGVPFVFCTGYGRAGLDQAFAHVPTLDKPYQEEALRGLLLSGLFGQAP